MLWILVDKEIVRRSHYDDRIYSFLLTQAKSDSKRKKIVVNKQDITLRGIAKYFRLSLPDADRRLKELIKLELIYDDAEAEEYIVYFPGKENVIGLDDEELRSWVRKTHGEYDGIITAFGEMKRLKRELNVSEISRLLGIDIVKAEYIQTRLRDAEV